MYRLNLQAEASSLGTVWEDYAAAVCAVQIAPPAEQPAAVE